MLRERHINGDPGGRGRRFLSSAADLVRWPFERAIWAVERLLLWPLGERFAGWTPAGRGVGAGALAVLAATAVLAGVLLLPAGEEPQRERVAAPARVAIVPPQSEPRAAEPSGPVLQGASPSFGVEKGAAIAKSGAESPLLPTPKAPTKPAARAAPRPRTKQPAARAARARSPSPPGRPR